MFSLAAFEQFAQCDKPVSFNTELHIRNGKALLIRNLKWLIAVDPVDEYVLGRRVMEALGLDSKKVLEALSDRYQGTVDEGEVLYLRMFPTAPFPGLCIQKYFTATKVQTQLTEMIWHLRS